MNNNIERLKPFKHFCMTIGAIPTSYLESMSYYETLCWLCKYLENTVVPTVNNNSEVVEELQEYVANYFDNLNVQEEINTKLDEMALDGTLAEIINVEMIGSLENLTTTDKTDIVSAINEVDSDITSITNDLSDLSEDINLAYTRIGTLANLTTTEKSNLVGAINEVNSNVSDNTSAISNLDENLSEKIGTLTSLTTTDKTDLVSAINEVNSFSSNFETVTVSFTIDDTTTNWDQTTVSYPSGFTKSNTIVLNSITSIPNKTDLYIGATGNSLDYINKNPGVSYILTDDNIKVVIQIIKSDPVQPDYYLAEGTYSVDLLLMKI